MKSTNAHASATTQIPTMRFDPVHINCDEYCAFPVADRSPALQEWMKTDDAKQCTHILLVGARACSGGTLALSVGALRAPACGGVRGDVGSGR